MVLFKTAKFGSLLTKSVTLLKSVIETAKVCSLSDESYAPLKLSDVGSFMDTFDLCWKVPLKLPRSAVCWPKVPPCWKVPLKLPRSAVWVTVILCHQNCQGWQFVSRPWYFVVFLLKSAIKTAKVCSLLTNSLKVLKSAIKTAKVWQFVYVATKLPSCGSLYPQKKCG